MSLRSLAEVAISAAGVVSEGRKVHRGGVGVLRRFLLASLRGVGRPHGNEVLLLVVVPLVEGGGGEVVLIIRYQDGIIESRINPISS